MENKDDILKIKLGQFFTKNNSFNNSVFNAWFVEALKYSKNKNILEPFVGNEDIIKLLKLNYKFDFVGYDIQPKLKKTTKKDTLKNFPTNYNITITNPPYLARNSATRKNIKWKYDGFDDLYKVSIYKMLKNCGYVAAIVPVTILKSGIFNERMTDYILLNIPMFNDTLTPVCLVLFKPEKSWDIRIWELSKNDINFVGTFYTIKNKLDQILIKKQNIKVKFNDVYGEYGIFATDKSYKSIKFVKGSMIPDDKVRDTSRNMVRFKTNKKLSVKRLNNKLNDFLNNDGEIFLAPFKNLRKDNKYRRRLDFKTIRRIIESC